METKDIIKYAAIAVGAYYVYTMIIAPAIASAASPSPAPGQPTGTAPTGTTNTQFPISPGKPPTSGTDTLPTHDQTPPPPPPPAVNATLASGDVGSDAWKARVKALLVNAAASGGAHNAQGTWRNVDDWAYFYQTPAIGGAGSISPALMQGIIDGTAASGDRSSLVVDNDFINALAASHTAGLGGLVYLGGLGTLWSFR